MMPDLEVRRVLWRQVTRHDAIRETMAGYLHYLIRGAGFDNVILVTVEERHFGKRGVWPLDLTRPR